MEFNIRGVLDENGQLQSVQSSCSNTPLHEAVPFSSPFRLQGAEVQESKVVNYAVKKELDRKLHVKVNEMSDLMIQLKHAQDSLEMSRKLNKEYEDKIKRQDKTIAELKGENANLRKIIRVHNIQLPDKSNCSTSSETFPETPEIPVRRCSAHSSETIPKTVRTSMTEITIGWRHSEISMTDSGYSKPFQPNDTENHFQSKTEETPDKENLEKGKHESGSESANETRSSKILVGAYVKPTRPNKLEIPKSFKSNAHCHKGLNDRRLQNENHKTFDIQSDSGVDQSDPNTTHSESGSCVIDDSPNSNVNSSKISNADLPENILSETCPDVGGSTNQADIKNIGDVPEPADITEPCRLPCDEDGYLIVMLPTNTTVFKRNKATRRKSSESGNPAASFDNRSTVGANDITDDPCFCSVCQCDTDVHVRWIDVHNCRHSCGSQCSPIDRHKHVVDEGAEDDCNIQHVLEDTHVTIPNDYAVIPDDIDEVFSKKEAARTDEDKDFDDRYAERAPAPLPRGLSGSLDLGSPGSPRNVDIEDTTYLSSERRKSQDHPNNVMKTMRMTSEWQSAKKELLERSHTCTSQIAENTLGNVVKKAIQCFQTEKEKSKKRNSKNLSEKLVKQIQQSLSDDHQDDVITTEFLQKVVQLCEREFL